MRVARSIILSPEQRKELEEVSRARSVPARQVERAGIVLRAAAGWMDKDIARDLGITKEKVARWRNRFLDYGMAVLRKNPPWPARPISAPPSKVESIDKALQRP